MKISELEKEFERLDLSVVQIFVMMVGELNYQSNILDKYLDDKLPFPFLTFHMFVMLIELHTNLEEKMPYWLLKR
ncbi:unnamed protein product, partial [Coregonus sp. 'balchen']